MSREISNQCLETLTTKCLVYTGSDIPALDIKNGDSIEYVIEQLAQQDIPEEVIQSFSINTFGIQILSTCAAKITSTPFTYNITATISSLFFSWDINTSLPAGYQYVGTVVKAVGNGLITESASRSASISIPLNRLPASIQIEQRVSSSCGDILLTKTIPITAALTGSYSAVFDVKDLNNSTSALDIQQAFDILFAMVVQNKQQIDDFQATHTLSALSVLDQRLTDIENRTPDTTVEYVDQGVSKDEELSTALTSAYALIRTNEANITQLQNEIDALKVQISNLA